jgi:hypothetical protein
VAPVRIRPVPAAGLSTVPRDALTVEDLSAIQAGVLAAMASSVALLLLRLRLARRAGLASRRAGRDQKRPAGGRTRERRPAGGPARVRLLPAEPVRPVPAPPVLSDILRWEVETPGTRTRP